MFVALICIVLVTPVLSSDQGVINISVLVSSQTTSFDKEHKYSFTPSQTEHFTITTCVDYVFTDLDTTLEIRNESESEYLAYNEDITPYFAIYDYLYTLNPISDLDPIYTNTEHGCSIAQAVLTTNQTYDIFVWGYAGKFGDYTLLVEKSTTIFKEHFDVDDEMIYATLAVDPPYNTHTYYLGVRAPQLVTITTCSAYTDFDTVLELIGANSSIMNYDSAVGCEASPYLNFVSTITSHLTIGIYKIVVGANNSYGNYSLMATSTTLQPTPVPTLPPTPVPTLPPTWLPSRPNLDFCTQTISNDGGLFKITERTMTPAQFDYMHGACLHFNVYLDNTLIESRVDNIVGELTSEIQLSETIGDVVAITIPVTWDLYSEYIVNTSDIFFLGYNIVEDDTVWFNPMIRSTNLTRVAYFYPGKLWLLYNTSTVTNRTLDLFVDTPPVEAGLSRCIFLDDPSEDDYTDDESIGQVTLIGLFDGVYTNVCFGGLYNGEIVAHYFEITIPPTSDGYDVFGNCKLGRLTNTDPFAIEPIATNRTLTYLTCVGDSPAIEIRFVRHNHTYDGNVTKIRDYETDIVVAGDCVKCVNLTNATQLKIITFDNYTGAINNHTFPPSVTTIRANTLNGDIASGACGTFDSIDVFGVYTGSISPTMGTCRFTVGCTSSPTPSPSQPLILDCDCPSASCSFDNQNTMNFRIAITSILVVAVVVSVLFIFNLMTFSK